MQFCPELLLRQDSEAFHEGVRRMVPVSRAFDVKEPWSAFCKPLCKEFETIRLVAHIHFLPRLGLRLRYSW
jgi:hypothetical protein